MLTFAIKAQAIPNGEEGLEIMAGEIRKAEVLQLCRYPVINRADAPSTLGFQSLQVANLSRR